MKTPVLTEESLGDEIIAEVHSVREALAAKFDFNLDQLFKEAKRRTKSRKHTMWNASPKRLSSSKSA